MTVLPQEVVDFISMHVIRGQFGMVGAFGVVVQRGEHMEPDVSPRNFVAIGGDLVTIDLASEWLPDALKKNPWACVNLFDPMELKGYDITGEAEYITSGPLFDEMDKKAREMGLRPIMGAIRIRPIEVRLAVPGPEGGKLIAGAKAEAGG